MIVFHCKGMMHHNDKDLWQNVCTHTVHVPFTLIDSFDLLT